MLLGKSPLGIALTPVVACCLVAFLPDLTAGTVPAASPGLVALTPADEKLLDELEHAGFLFFAEQAHPRTGLVRDRARADGSASEGKASVAASGFAFPA